MSAKPTKSTRSPHRAPQLAPLSTKAAPASRTSATSAPTGATRRCRLVTRRTISTGSQYIGAMVWFEPGGVSPTPQLLVSILLVQSTTPKGLHRSRLVHQPHALRLLDVYRWPIHPDNVISLRCCIYCSEEVPSPILGIAISRVGCPCVRSPGTTQTMKNDRADDLMLKTSTPACYLEEPLYYLIATRTREALQSRGESHSPVFTLCIFIQ